MMEEKLDARDLLDVDRLPMIEAKVAFIAMAASALGMLDSKGLLGRTSAARALESLGGSCLDNR